MLVDFLENAKFIIYNNLLSSDEANVLKKDICKLFTLGSIRSPFLGITNKSLDLNVSNTEKLESEFGNYIKSTTLVQQLLLGSTIRIKSCEQFLPAINQLKIRYLPKDCNYFSTVFITGSGFSGLPMHTDPHYSLLLQLAGKKRWNLWYESDTKSANCREPDIVITLETGMALFITPNLVHCAISSGHKCSSIHLTLACTKQD